MRSVARVDPSGSSEFRSVAQGLRNAPELHLATDDDDSLLECSAPVSVRLKLCQEICDFIVKATTSGPLEISLTERIDQLAQAFVKPYGLRLEM